MGQGRCVDGQLVTTSYASPVPIIGLYIAVASLVCFCLMSFDLVYGFIRKKLFLPCKSFPLNSITLTIVAAATKIPVDLTTSMPRAEDQLSKLTGTALMCTVIGFYMPSLGSMSTSERYGNLASLTIVAITMVVNVCIQMRTGVIFAFTAEHIIILICTLIMILSLWSSVVAFKGRQEIVRFFDIRGALDRSGYHGKGLRGLKNLIGNLFVINFIFDPATILLRDRNLQTLGFLCIASSAAVSQAIVRTFALKSVRLCTTSSSSSSGSVSSDYEWSISLVIVTQVLAIAVGTFSIIYRCFAVGIWDNRWANRVVFGSELESLKLKGLPLRFLGRNMFRVFLVAKDFIIDMLICTQAVFHVCSFFIVLPFALVIYLCSICIFHKKRTKKNEEDHIDHDHQENKPAACELAMETETQDDFKSSLSSDFLDKHRFLVETASKRVKRWANTYQSGDYRPTHLMSFISKFSPALLSKSECAELVTNLGRIGEEKNLGREVYSYYDHRVSCLTVVVLSAVVAKIMPSSRTRRTRGGGGEYDSVMQILEESLKIIYYVEQKTTNAPNSSDKTRWRSVKYFLGRWEDPKDWFQTVFQGCRSLEKSEEESRLKLEDVVGILMLALPEKRDFVRVSCKTVTFAELHDYLCRLELATICEFILDQKHESVKDLLDFLEMCFAKLLCFSLSALPQAIVKEIDEEYPSDIGEERVMRALKFLCILEQLSQGTKIEWSWPPEFEPQTQQTDVVDDISQMVAAASCSSSAPPIDQVSNVNVQQDQLVGNTDASPLDIHDHAASDNATPATPAAADNDDDNDDRIVELGSFENV